MINLQLLIGLINRERRRNLSISELSLIHSNALLDDSGGLDTVWGYLRTARFEFGNSENVVDDSLLMLCAKENCLRSLYH